MTRIRALATATLLAAALATPAAAAPPQDSTLGGTCNGSADYNCSYCSYQGSNSDSAPFYCNRGDEYYRWESCTVFVAGVCYVG